MALSRRKKLIIVFLVFYWPTLFVLAHIPIPRLVWQVGVSDKALHFLSYLILVFLFWSAVASSEKVNWRRASAWLVLLVTVSYGAIDELLQNYGVGRTCDIMDFFADLAAVLSGLILLSVLTFWPALLVLTGTTILGLTNLARANLADKLPITNTVFHVSAYGFFTLIWLQNLRLFLRSKPAKPTWTVLALSIPIGFLFAVKLFSAILGKYFIMRDVIISAAAIASVIAVYLLATSLFCRKQAKAETLPPLDSQGS
jgi:VanZ family protein